FFQCPTASSARRDDFKSGNLRHRHMVSHTPKSSPSIKPRKAVLAGAIRSSVSFRKVNGPGVNAFAQPVGIGTGQNRLLVTADLAGRNASGLPPQILPLRHTGRADLKRFCDRTNGLARVSSRKSAFANVFRKRSRHPCWPPLSSMELESEILPAGNPDSGKKQHALKDGARRRWP
ncbi:hypothetical protein, partial [Bradyrhizobium sp. 153]|uniref:hypothetical protein n=1 Tax=Bradyrhizobium sp. 153 TaxID=2782627 RepID=UPI001FF83980